jgi:hypothetical protein
LTIGRYRSLASPSGISWPPIFGCGAAPRNDIATIDDGILTAEVEPMELEAQLGQAVLMVLDFATFGRSAQLELRSQKKSTSCVLSTLEPLHHAYGPRNIWISPSAHRDVQS